MKTRFTVLTSRLIRCEYQPEGRFEDRPTQWVLNRDFPVVPFRQDHCSGTTTIETDALLLTCRQTGKPFTADSLTIALKTGVNWRYGDANPDNLGGTARTLDECDGAINRRENNPLHVHPGIFSRSGWAVLDDAASFVLNAGDLPESRGPGFVQDFYFFAYGHDFASGLRDFYNLTGRPPLIPEWALGVWWSRWEKYTSDDLRRIIAEFEEHDVPLSTLVIDMDWHVVNNPYTNGWTGYTWNKDFFPDPEAFFTDIHTKGIHACLNLHPASGVHPHEEAYRDFATFMGMNPDSKTPIPFNPTDPKFIEGYFKFLHHPHEKTGVDFWWIDWQQGRKTPFGDIDPLWMLNHLHSADLARDRKRRPFTFSRWCGAGAHRYPIGFSGDTFRTWRTLRYEIEFTSRTANLGFGWWSHDLGGFARGVHDDELYLRWLQFGALSPIFRLHNAGDPTVDHRPWSKENRFCEPALHAMRLRRALRPYLYTQARDNADGGLPIVRPMYYEHADTNESFQWPSQYYFGNDLIAAPVTSAAHPETGCTTTPVWLPQGDWCEFFTGATYAGNRVHALHASRETIPLFARAGAIIPTSDPQDVITEILCFPGRSGQADLYRDDGESLAYQTGQFARYRLAQTLDGDQWTFTVERTGGDLARDLPIRIVLRGYSNLTLTGITENGKPANACPLYLKNGDLLFPIGCVSPDGLRLTATLNGSALTQPAPTHAGLVQLLQHMPINCHFVRPLLDNWETTLANPSSLAKYACDLTDAQLRVLTDYLYDAGSALLPIAENQYQLSWWNSRADARLSIRLSTREECEWQSFRLDTTSAFGSRPIAFGSAFHSFRCETDLLGIATVTDCIKSARDICGDR